MPPFAQIDRLLAYSPDEGGAGGGGNSDDGNNDDGGAGGSGGTDTLEELKGALAKERDRASNAEKLGKQQANQLKTLQEQLDTLKQQSMSDSEKAIADARKEAADAATQEATQKFNRRILEAEVKIRAAGKLNEPDDAVRLLDLDDFAVGDDGSIDHKPIDRAITDLLKDKPYLAAGEPRRRHGSGDGGPRKETSGGSDMNSLLRQAAGKG